MKLIPSNPLCIFLVSVFNHPYIIHPLSSLSVQHQHQLFEKPFSRCGRKRMLAAEKEISEYFLLGSPIPLEQ
uniref:Uncharacterized protein n=1 Tax=Rhizophora mucronata TaxID=61149 RepID=A0A2P2KLA3_RHIMU